MGPGESLPGGEADHSLPSSAEIKNNGALLSFLTHHHGMVLNQLSPDVMYI
jgi:hypothetical protein